MKAAKIFLLAGLTGVMAVNLSFAQTWTQTSAPSNYWSSVASSADGTKLIASSIPNATPPPRSVIKGGVWISLDSGTTWQEASLPVTQWDKVACSADGDIMFAVSDYYSPYSASFCVSTNSGLTWTSNGISAFGGSFVCSADGSRVAALLSQNGTNFLCTSSDFGATLAASFPPINGSLALACSADGKRLAAVGTNTCISTNAGVSWIVTNSLPDNVRITAVSSSADGMRLVGVTPVSPPGPSALFISTNGGFAWTKTAAPLTNWIAVASSANGSQLAAIGFFVPPSGPINQGIPEPSHPIYTSTNAGATWKLNTVSAGLWWSSIASSADGTKFVAVATYGGGIWISQSKPAPAMQLMPSNNNLKLSWLVPSTNFVLQQSADLSGWTDMTNQPALNFTNLKEEVFLPLSGSNSFFRLKTP